MPLWKCSWFNLVAPSRSAIIPASTQTWKVSKTVSKRMWCKRAFATYSLQLCTIELVRAPCELLKVNAGPNSHLATVDLEDACAGGLVGEGEFDLAVETARTKKSGVKNIDTVRCCDDLKTSGANSMSTRS